MGMVVLPKLVVDMRILARPHDSDGGTTMMGGMTGCCGMMGGMGIGMLAWGLFLLALFVLAVLGIVWLLRTMSGTRNTSAQSRQDSPLTELERRYACGEIDREEFLRRREDLAGTPLSSAQ
jgi:putative membrane protein